MWQLLPAVFAFKRWKLCDYVKMRIFHPSCAFLSRGLPLDERQSAAELEAVLQHHHNLQEKLAEDMLNLARNLKNNTLAAQNIIKQDNQVSGWCCILSDLLYLQHLAARIIFQYGVSAASLLRQRQDEINFQTCLWNQIVNILFIIKAAEIPMFRSVCLCYYYHYVRDDALLKSCRWLFMIKTWRGYGMFFFIKEHVCWYVANLFHSLPLCQGIYRNRPSSVGFLPLCVYISHLSVFPFCLFPKHVVFLMPLCLIPVCPQVGSIRQHSWAVSQLCFFISQTLGHSMRQADLNLEKLKTESERLEQHTKKSVNWLLWLMLILVSFTFISMILFIRIFPRLRWQRAVTNPELLVLDPPVFTEQSLHRHHRSYHTCRHRTCWSIH